MALAAGSKIGPYEILAPIGAGGMGEVYRARDTKLQREVAIKVLPEAFATDPDRIVRFTREALLLASLNHPGIAHIYGVEERALVMELVPGPTLADRIAAGPIPLEEALPVAAQIAEAVEYAHDHNVMHRDLKPANIKITPEGTVKVLDFGLAKALADQPDLGDPRNSPTLTLTATRVGVVLGTAGYMAPEQARGKPVDKRADIWAFGVVLYEMLTGQRLFEGDTVSDTLAAVLKETPDWNRVPARVRTLLRRCLERDPKRRLRDIGDALALLELTEEKAPGPAPLRRWLWPGAAALATLGAAAVSFIHFREKPPAPAEPVRFQIPVPEKAGAPGYVAVSPDGRKVAFTAGSGGAQRIWVRTFDLLDAKPLAGTENAAPPFWSPDSRYVAFSVDQKLKKIDISGGPAQTLCDVPGAVVGGSWSRDDVILFGSFPAGPLMQISGSGGVPSPATAVNPSRKETLHILPTFLPDGRHFLYFRPSSAPEYSGIYVGSLDAKPDAQDSRRLALPGPVWGYVPSPDPGSGWVLFLRESSLVSQGFDARRLELTGQPVVVAERVGSYNTMAQVSASANGVLVYGNGASLDLQATWMDRQGKVVGAAGESGPYLMSSLSPSGAHVAVSRGSPAQANIWLLDLARGSSTKLTFGPSLDTSPVWSPDGSRIAYSSTRGGSGMYQKATDGTGEDELLLKAGFPRDWSRDKRYLLYESSDAKTKSDLWVLPLDGAGAKPFAFVRTEFNETYGTFSPDSRWIAYASDESGRLEIYVRPFTPPSAGAASVSGKWMVSKDGGTRPRWRRDGKELFFLDPDGKMMAADVTADSVFRPGVPRVLFSAAVSPFHFDVAADGSKFLVGVPVAQNAQTPLTVVLNWTAGLKK